MDTLMIWSARHVSHVTTAVPPAAVVPAASTAQQPIGDIWIPTSVFAKLSIMMMEAVESARVAISAVSPAPTITVMGHVMSQNIA